MRCGKCGALISDINSVCPGCGTPASELEMNNMLIRENNSEGVVVMPDVVNIGNDNTEVTNIVSPEVSVEPVVEIANVNMAAQVPSEPSVATTPESVVVDTVPPVVIEQQNVIETPVVDSPVMVSPVSEPVTIESPVVDVPVAEQQPTVVEAPVEPVVPEVASVLETAPTVEATPEVNAMPSGESVAPDVVSPVENSPASEPVGLITSVEENSVVTSKEENNIINSVVSEVNAPETPGQESATGSVSNEPVVAEPKKSKKGLFIIIGVVVAFILMAVGAYIFMASKPSYLYKTFASRIREGIVASMNEEAVPTQVSLTLKTDLKIENVAMKETFDKINNLYLETTMYTDMKNQVMALNLLTKYKGNTLIGLDAFVEKEMGYVKLQDILNKYIAMDFGQNIFEDNKTSEDAVNVIEGLLLAFEESIEDKYFEKEEIAIKINGVSTNVKANTLVLNKENAEAINKSMFASLKANDKFIESFAATAGLEKDAVIAMLDDTSVDMKQDEVIKFSIYIKGTKDLAGFAISDAEGKYSFLISDKNISVVYSVADTETELLNVTFNSEEEFTISLYNQKDVYSVIVGLKTEENPNFTKPDVSNSVLYTELSQEDMQTLAMGLMSPTITEFMADFEPLIQMAQMMMGMSGLGDSAYSNSDVDYAY